MAWGRQCSSSAPPLLSSQGFARSLAELPQGERTKCIQGTRPLWQLARQRQYMIAQFGPPRRVVVITFTIKLVDVQHYPQGNDIVNIVLTQRLSGSFRLSSSVVLFGKSLQEHPPAAHASRAQCCCDTLVFDASSPTKSTCLS